MPEYSKQVAKQLYSELQQLMKSIPDQIDKASDDGPVLMITCKSLEKAISALKTGK